MAGACLLEPPAIYGCPNTLMCWGRPQMSTVQTYLLLAPKVPQSEQYPLTVPLHLLGDCEGRREEAKGASASPELLSGSGTLHASHP